MSTYEMRQLAKHIAGAPIAHTPTRQPQGTNLTRGVIVGLTETNGPQVTAQIAGSNVAVPVDVVDTYAPTVGDVVEILVAPPRLLVLGPSSTTGGGEVEPGAWIEAIYENGWTTRSGYDHVQYRLSADQAHIELFGACSGGTSGTAVFTLPTPALVVPSGIRVQLMLMDGGTGFLVYDVASQSFEVTQMTGTAGTGSYFYGISVPL